MSASSTELFDSSIPWALSAEVSLRDEAFGALAYHHGNRRLVFLKSVELVSLVRQLASFASVDDAVAACAPATERARYVRALHSLVSSEIIRAR